MSNHSCNKSPWYNFKFILNKKISKQKKKGCCSSWPKICLQCGFKWVCKSYKYNLLPNIAMPTDVHGKYILHLRQSIYWRSQLILSISRLTSWPILKNVTRLGSRYISKRGFLMFKIIASISWCLLWLTKTKQKKSKGWCMLG